MAESGVIALGRAVGRVTALVGANPGVVVVVGVGSTTMVVGSHGWVTTKVVVGVVLVTTESLEGGGVGIVLLTLVLLGAIVTMVVGSEVTGGGYEVGGSVIVVFTSGTDVGPVGGTVTVGGTVSVAFVTGGGMVVSGGGVPVGVAELPVPGRIVNGMVITGSSVAVGAVDVGSTVLVLFAVLGSVTSDTIVLSSPPMPPRRPSLVDEEETTPVGASRIPDEVDELDNVVASDDTGSDESADAVEFAVGVGSGVVVLDLRVGSTMSGGSDPVGATSSEVALELLLGKGDAGKVSISSLEPVDDAGGSVLEGFG